jgi:hypothetical protein
MCAGNPLGLYNALGHSEKPFQPPIETISQHEKMYRYTVNSKPHGVLTFK